MKRSAKNLVWIGAVLASMAISVYFRLYPLTVYPEYAAQARARILIYSNVKKSVEKYIENKYASVPPARRSEIKDGTYKEFLNNQKSKIDIMSKKIGHGAAEDQKALHPTPYLMEVDPYYYLELTRDLVAKKPAPRVKGREYFNDKMLAPTGAWYPMDYHPYVGLVTYRIISSLKKDIPLEEAVGWVPLILSTLCVVAFFFLGARVFAWDCVTTFLASVYLVLCPVFLRRSLWGWYDTDSYNILFPILILFFLFSYLKEKDSSKKKNIFLLLSTVAVSAYSLFWRGWLLEHALISVAVILTAVVTKKRREAAKIAAVYVLGPVFFTLLIWGPQGFASLLKEGAAMIKDFYLPAFSLWPDVFLTVGELRHSSFLKLAAGLGGPWIVILIAIGFVSVFWDKSKKNTVKIGVIAAGLLFLICALLGAGIERFTLLAVVPSALGAGLGIQRLALWSEKIKGDPLTDARRVVYALILAGLLWQAHRVARIEHPIYNSSWDRMMTYLREETPKDSIVTSWWSPGHFLSSMGQRRVTFDGATQNTPQAYWVGNLFLEKSEDKAAAILKMLNLSGNDALQFLTEEKNRKLSEAVGLLHEILPLDKKEALRVASEKLNHDDAAKLIALTHSVQTPVPSYVLIYNDMVTQVMALEYTGKWNFSKAEALRDRLNREPSKISKAFLRHNSKEHVLLQWALSDGPYAQEPEAYEQKREGSDIYFSNGLVVNPDSLNARLYSKKFGSGIPKNIYRMRRGRLEKQTLEGGNLNVSALLIKEGSAYKSIVADEKLLESLIFRLYYLKGEGLLHFRLVASDESAANQTKLYVYRVLWSGD